MASTVKELQAACPEVDILVVDDGSADGTAAEAAAAGALVCRLPFNLGVGGAMRAGLPLRPAARLRRRGAGRRRRPARPVVHPEPWSRRWTTPTSSSAPGSPGRAATPPAGRGAGRWRCWPACSRRLAGTATDRRHQRLPGRQPARDPGLRRPLPRRVPRRHRRVAGHRAALGLHRHPGAGRPCGSRGRRHGEPVATAGGGLPARARWSPSGSALVRRWPTALETPPKETHEANSDPRADRLVSPCSCSSRCCVASRLREKYAVFWGVRRHRDACWSRSSRRCSARRRTLVGVEVPVEPALLRGQHAAAGDQRPAQPRARSSGGAEPDAGRGGRAASSGSGLAPGPRPRPLTWHRLPRSPRCSWPTATSRSWSRRSRRSSPRAGVLADVVLVDNGCTTDAVEILSSREGVTVLRPRDQHGLRRGLQPRRRTGAR